MQEDQGEAHHNAGQVWTEVVGPFFHDCLLRTAWLRQLKRGMINFLLIG